ncbi:MAG: hypothetical protein HY542_05945, partial [Deltaproteobacteria bacterium]|nr:hypothetical protein [Deltaproteobacteria bacterium]
MNANTLRWIGLSAAAALSAGCGWFSDDSDYEVRSGGGTTPPTGSNPPHENGMDDEVPPPDAGVPDAPMPSIATHLLVIGSDYTNGEIRSFDLANYSFGSSLAAHSDAGAWVFEGQKWVVNRRGRDSFQGFGLTNNSPTTPEIFLSAGSNPQSVLVRGGYAYLPLYETSEVVKYDIAAEMPVDWYNLTPYTVDDGDRNARPSASHFADDSHALFGNQDLPTDLWNSPTSSYTAPAKLVVLNTDTGRLEEEAIELPFSNVVSITSDPGDADILYASCSGTYDTSDSRGGIAKVRFSERRVIGTITDNALAGTPGPIAAGAGRVFAVVSTNFASLRVVS